MIYRTTTAGVRQIEINQPATAGQRCVVGLCPTGVPAWGREFNPRPFNLAPTASSEFSRNVTFFERNTGGCDVRICAFPGDLDGSSRTLGSTLDSQGMDLMLSTCVVAFLLTLTFVGNAELAFGPSAPALNTEDPARDAERQLMLHRSSIGSGVLKVESRYTREGQTREIDYTVIFDETGTRISETEAYRGEWMRGDVFSTTYVFTKDKRVLRYCDKKSPNGGKIVASIRPRTEDMLLNHVDPRLIGMIPSSFGNLTHYSMNTIFGTVDWKIEDTEFMKLKDDDCLYVRYAQTQGDTVAEFWIDLDRDANVLRAIITAPDNACVESIDCELGRVDNFGWFPSKVVYRRIENGRTVATEDARIRVEHFNKTVSPDWFTLKGIGAPDGWSVIDYTVRPSKEYELRHGQLVEVAKGNGPPIPEGSPGRRRGLMVFGFILAVVALALLVRRKRHAQVP